MKRMCLTLWSLLMAFSLTACGVGEAPLNPTPLNSTTITESTSFAQAPPSSTTHKSTTITKSTSVVQAPPSSTTHKSTTITKSTSVVQVPPNSTQPESTQPPSLNEESTMHSIQIAIGDRIFFATLEKNDAASSFLKLLQNAPIVIQMRDYSGFEKVGSLKTSLPESNRQITAQAGDIILYNSNQICVFYGSNTWSYTKLGKIDDLSGWAEALGSGDVSLTFSYN